MVCSRGLYQGAKQALVRRSGWQVLGVPLHADREVVARIDGLDRLHDPVRVARRDPQPRAEAVDALAMQTVDAHRLHAHRGRDERARFEIDPLVSHVRGSQLHARQVGHEILKERAAGEHVEHLCPAADPQERQARRHRALEHVPLELIALGVIQIAGKVLFRVA